MVTALMTPVSLVTGLLGRDLIHKDQLIRLTGKYAAPWWHQTGAKRGGEQPPASAISVEVKSCDPDISITRWVKLTDICEIYDANTTN